MSKTSGADRQDFSKEGLLISFSFENFDYSFHELLRERLFLLLFKCYHMKAKTFKSFCKIYFFAYQLVCQLIHQLIHQIFHQTVSVKSLQLAHFT